MMMMSYPICDLSRENVPCEIRLNSRVCGKLTACEIVLTTADFYGMSELTSSTGLRNL